jgi:transcriptional regulator GlxA family with amidase domain
MDAKFGPRAAGHACHFGKEQDGTAMTGERTVTTVAILAFPETTASLVYGMYDLFMSVGRDWELIVNGRPGPQLLEPLIVSATGESFRASNDIAITPHATLSAMPAASVVCVPELTVPPGEPLEGRFDAEEAWLRERYEAGALIAAACSGAMLLAEAGLLDGQDATTHWAYCDILARRFPTVRVAREQALVISGEGGRLIMAGGGTAWHDLALYVVARVVGVEEAMRVARVNLINWHSAGQQPFARLARTAQADDAVIARAQEWIAERFHEPAPVAAMTEVSGLPERSFKRRFQQATGMSPIEYVHTLRLEEAKQMLERLDHSVEAVAFQVGYEDAGFFRRLFKRRVGMGPAQYRKKFASLRSALQA